jgi:hypothetical protein
MARDSMVMTGAPFSKLLRATSSQGMGVTLVDFVATVSTGTTSTRAPFSSHSPGDNGASSCTVFANVRNSRSRAEPRLGAETFSTPYRRSSTS